MNIIQNIFKSGPSSATETYKEAHYFNYYRKLELKNKNEKEVRSRIGLIPKVVNSNSQSFTLTDFDIEAVVTDSSVISVFTQKYTNEMTSPVEATYKMPLPPYATVCDFVVTYDDKVLKGKIKEKQKAQEKYSDNIASGGQSFMAEKSDDGFFTLSIGNLPPTKQVAISLTIISEIGAHLENLHYCLHRYMFPGNNFNVNFNLNVFSSQKIDKISLDHYSPSIKYAEDKKSATVKFSSNGIKRNIVAVIQPAVSKKPEYFLEYSAKDKTYAVGLNFYPKFEISREEVDQKAEFIFLLDCSGSMSGSSINQAKRALEIVMRSLTENNKFNIYLFGSSYKKLFPSSQIYNDDTLEKASAHITTISANLGGTELLPPIKDILALPYDPEYPRQVMIFTDGEISQRDELIDYVGKESNTTRIFTFGIGSGVDTELVVGLSKACKGYFEMIKDNSKMEEQVLSLLSIAMEPTLSNIKVEWPQDQIKVTQAPKQIRPIYNGERMMIYGLIDEKLTESNTIPLVLTGNGPSGQLVKYELELNFENAKSDSTHLHSLAAFNIINDLEEEERKDRKDHKDRIVQLGKKYSLVSKHTSFLVTAESDQVTTDTMVPVEVLKKDTTSSYQQQSQPNKTSILYSSNTSVPSLPRSSSPTSRGGSSAVLSKSRKVSYSNSSPIPPPPPPMAGGGGGSFPPPPPSGPPPMAPGGMAFPIVQSSVSSSSWCCDEEEDNSSGSVSCDEQEELGGLVLNDSMDTQIESCKNISISLPESVEKKEQSDFKLKKKLSSPSKEKKQEKDSGSASKLLASPKPVSQSSSSSTPLPSQSPSRPVQKVSTGDLLLDLIKAQKANGSWAAESLTFTVPTVPSGYEILVAEIWITLFVIAKITKSFSSKKSQWELVVNKATKYVKSQLTKENKSDQFDKLLKLAESGV
ncbi:hypothetical protein DLAC_08793 [Tieghemostelium lacteum]|uniref:Type A von Willebrand factor domain-containing protein n=1 Tax=Tieghemostelium lacteum TaxID=361077 RepID=A0A151Z8D2_TIELA|nr:hypothetical protein DLAC_08793 [Tieghemostelium lacteum]|eukprot:KYQ90195.1 hypothetical protein DLAC_08793 [Tieghemostelium lacteum]